MILMMPGSASGVFSAALWKRMILPGWTLLSTRFCISAAEMPFQSRLSTSHCTAVMPMLFTAFITWSSYSPYGQRKSVGVTPVNSEIFSLQAVMSAMMSLWLSCEKCECVEEWFIISLPFSASARTDSGYLSTQSPTTKKVVFISYLLRMSMSVCVSSLPHAASKDMATTRSSRCTQYTGSCRFEAETPTIAGLFTVQNMSTTISSVPKADSTRLYLWKTLFCSVTFHHSFWYIL